MIAYNGGLTDNQFKAIVIGLGEFFLFLFLLSCMQSCNTSHNLDKKLKHNEELFYTKRGFHKQMVYIIPQGNSSNWKEIIWVASDEGVVNIAKEPKEAK